MIRRFILCLLIMMPFCMITKAATWVDGIYYNFNKTAKTATVTYYSHAGMVEELYKGAVNIPPTVDYEGETYDVTAIGQSAFSNCKELTSVTIPASVTSIGDRAFQGCGGLSSITLPPGVTSIGLAVFAGCPGLTSFTIPSTVTSIGESAFGSCTGLTSIEIPSTVTSIGRYAFSGCTGLTAVTIPSSVTSLEDFLFWKCTGLTSVTIPSSVTSIGSYVFTECSGLTSITIPNGVTKICGSAFSNCPNLTSITIPASVTSIGNAVFFECPSLASVVVESGNTVYDSRQNCNAIIETATDELIFGCKNAFIPDGVRSIRGSAFANVLANAFAGCSGLTSLVIPASVTNIGSYAFWNCTDLTSVTIGSSTAKIEVDAFRGCTALMTVKSFITEPDNISKFENETYRQGKLYVPYGTKELYARFDGWREFLRIEEMEEGATPNANGACAVPTIVVVGGKFKFQCETPGATFTSTLTTEEQFTGDEVVMGSDKLTYTLTVYANAPGYDQSEPATYTFTLNKSDVNRDGTVDVADIATIITTMAK